MGKKKECMYIWIFFSIFVFGVLYFTGTLTSGYHFVDDHEIMEFSLQMKESGNNVFTCIKDKLMSDLFHRFRPLYYIIRISLTSILGTNLLPWSILKGIETTCAMITLYYFARHLNCKILDSILFTLITMVGPQSCVWWKLGPQECTGILFLAIALFCWLKYKESNLKRYWILSLLFFFLDSLMKESFIMMFPFAMLFVLYIEMKNQPFSLKALQAAIKKNIIILSILALILIMELYFIVFVVSIGTGYAGLNKAMGIRYYIDVLLNNYEKHLGIKWFIRFGMLFCLLILTLGKKVNQLFWYILLTLFMMIPQFILYSKCGIEERYVLPFSFAFAFFFILAISSLSFFSGPQKNLFYILVICMLIVQTRLLIMEANYFAYRGKSIQNTLNKVLELSSGNDTKILSAFTSNAESDMTTSEWLMMHGQDHVYIWNDNKCIDQYGYGQGEEADLSEMDIIMFYNPEDRHYASTPDFDLSDYDVEDIGTLTLCVRK